MKVVINKLTGEIIRAVSNSSLSQVTSNDEKEIEVHDKNVENAIMKGLGIYYDSNTSSFVIPDSKESITESEQAILELSTLLSLEQMKNQENEQAIMELTMIIAGGYA